MDLSIIIVNYKTPQLLADCLSSIISHTADVQFEIIVVDNNSLDNSEQLTRSLFPQVKWIQFDYNAGFARANNEGIRQSSGEIVLLINSDTVVADNAIGACYQQFRSSKYVACGVQLLNADGTFQISGNFFVTGGLNNLLPLPYTGAFFRWFGRLFKIKSHEKESSDVREVDWINGAFLMVKKEAIVKAGLMDEDFFLYAEEAEWCSRLRKIGNLAIYGQFKVIHLQGETSNTTFKSKSKGYQNLYDRKGLQIMLSNFVRIRKQFGRGWFIFHLLIYSLTVPIYLIGIVLRTLLTLNNPRHGLKELKGFFFNILHIWGFAWTILMNKSYFYKVL